MSTTPALPTNMKAVVLSAYGEPKDVLTVDNDVSVPTPNEGEILVKVAAAGMNPVDYKIVTGEFPGHEGKKIGFDVSGTVASIGEGTETALAVGDAVYGDAALIFGTFAEYCIVKEIALHKKPANISFVEAASMPLAGLTALQGIVTQGEYKEGARVCIFGGSGGVGSLAVQMAKALGASEIVATGSSADFIKGMGATKVINYKEEDVVEALKDGEFDIMYDTVGGHENCAGGLKKGGVFVTIVGDWNKAADGTGLKSYKLFLTDTSAPEVQKDMAQISEWVESGKVKPVLDERRFTLTTESVHEMFAASMSHRTKGKIVLRVDS